MTTHTNPALSNTVPRWQRLAPWLLPVLLLVLMALRPLATPDEGRYAEVGRWMLVSGDWLVQRLNGIPFFHKPPLLYWLEASVFAVLGASPWAARLVIASHAVLMWAMLWLCARYWAGPVVARRAVWMLGASAAFLIGGQYVNHDTMVATWIGLAIWCFARALLHARPVHAGWARAGFVACALGVLSKGLIGLVLPGLVLFVWITWTRQWRKVPQLPWFSGVALFALIAVPWFVLAERAAPGMLAYLFGTQQFGRFGATTFNNGQPVWFYGVAIGVLLFPWAFIALGGGVAQLRRTWMQRRAAKTTSTDAPWISLCWIWIAAILGFFSIPNSKLIGYALPVMPPLALLAAHAWQTHLAPRRWAPPLWPLLVAGSVALTVSAQVLLTRVSVDNSSAGVAAVLRQSIASAAPDVRTAAQVVVVGGGEYPYDLPFLAQLQQPMRVVQDWERERREAGDTWHRELLDGTVFDAQAARVLVPYAHLDGLVDQAGVWLVVERGSVSRIPDLSRWQPLAESGRWRLYVSKASALPLRQ